MKPAIFAILCSFTLLSYAREDFDLSLEQKLKLKIIEEHWKEKDYALAKGQIENYLSTYPDHFAASHLHLMVADLFFSDKDYAQALAHYEKVQDLSFASKTFEQKLYCKLMLKDYKGIKECIKSQNLSQPAKRIVAEALFLEAKDSKDIDYKNALVRAAKRSYEEFLGGSLEDSVLLPYADILRYEENYSQAADIYQKIASKEKEEEKKAYYLYQAAQMYSFCDKNKASLLFDKLRWGISSYAFQAALKQIQMHAANRDYQKIIHIADEELITGNNPSSSSILFYYKGKALLAEGRLEEAVATLKMALTQQSLAQDIKKKTCLALLYSAKQLKNAMLADYAMNELKSVSSDDSDLCSAYLVHLALNIELEKFEFAKEDLHYLIEMDANPQNKQRYLLDLGVIEAKLGKYEASCKIFENFLTAQEKSPLFIEAAKNFIKSVSSFMEDDQPLISKKEEIKKWLPAFHVVSSNKEGLNREESEKFDFLFAKVLYDTGDKEKALEQIINIFSYAQSSKVLFVSHLLAAKIYEDKFASSDKILYHLKQAIELEDRASSKAYLHIRAFNLMLGKDEELAAEQLFSAYTLEPKRVQNNNLLWLAHFYFKKAISTPVHKTITECPDCLLYAQKSLRLFATAFEDKNSLQAEPMISCARLLYRLKRNDESADLLEQALKTAYFSSQQKAEISFYLAQVQNSLGNASKALFLFDQILKLYPPSTSKIGQKAFLEKCKIAKNAYFKQGDNEKKNKELLELFSQLKLLEITRLDVFEPVGVEASLDTLELKLALCAKEEKDEEAKRLYSALKEKYEGIRNALIQKDTSQSLKTAELISFYLIFIEKEIKQFTGSAKADTYHNQEMLNKIKLFEQRSDSDAEYLRQRLSCTF